MTREIEIVKVMLNLSKLKDADNANKKGSVTHDYTIEERAEIKSFSESEKAKHVLEGGLVSSRKSNS